MIRIRRSAHGALLCIVLLASACSERLPTSVTLTPGDLPNIVVQASEAPEGTEYRVKQSGAESLEKFGRPGEQRTTLAANGFSGAYRVSISSDAFLDYPSDPRKWQGLDFVENQAVTLNNAGGARKVLEYYREITTRPDQSPDMKAFDVTDLGEQAYAFRGKIVGVAPAVVLYWRRGNVFSSLTIAGTEEGIDADIALRLARASDQRIAALA
jgi:hypothetical protein